MDTRRIFNATRLSPIVCRGEFRDRFLYALDGMPGIWRRCKKTPKDASSADGEELAWHASKNAIEVFRRDTQLEKEMHGTLGGKFGMRGDAE